MTSSPSTRPNPVEPDPFGPDDETDLTWGVGAVAERLGIAASTLRTWERRYGVGPSHRTRGGHRRYVEGDIERVEVLHRLVARGVSAQDAARVARTLDREGLAIALEEPTEEHVLDPVQLLDAVIRAALTFDTDGLQDAVDQSLRRERFLDAWRGILAPALVRVATEGASGTLAAEASDLATQVLLARLTTVAPTRPDEAPDVLLATSAPLVDTVPLVALDAALRSADVPTRFLDAGTSVPALAQAVDELAPRVVVLWSHHDDVDPAQFDDDVAVLRAGPGWPHELRLAAGSDPRAVAMDVAQATDLVLDRLRPATA